MVKWVTWLHELKLAGMQDRGAFESPRPRISSATLRAATTGSLEGFETTIELDRRVGANSRHLKSSATIRSLRRLSPVHAT